MTTNSIENSRKANSYRETSGRPAYVEDTSPSIGTAQANAGEISCNSYVQRRRETSMVTNPIEITGGRNPREVSGRLACVGETSPTMVIAQANTGETSGGSLVQRQRETSMATNPRENSREEHNSRKTCGRLAYVGETSPTVASTQTNTRETSGSSLV